MILIVDLCWKKDSLSSEEFVKPIERIVKSDGKSVRVVHYSEINEPIVSQAEAVILCGTAVADNDFLNHDFSWIKRKEKVFGICAGMQVIAKAFGGEIINKKEIGMTEIKCNDGIFEKEKLSVYQLHGNSTTLPDGFSEIASNCNAFKKGKIYGIQFHPEVRNEHILINWLKL